MNLNPEFQSNFRGFTQQLYQNSAMNILASREQISNDVVRNEFRESESFMPAMTAVCSSESSRLIGGEVFKSLLDESSSDLDIPTHFLRQYKYDSHGISSVANIAVPPISNSFEMNSIDPIFYAQTECQQESKYETFQMHLNDQDIAFSPLVSPEITPHEFQVNVLGYPVSGPYFTPLNSPALQAQNCFSPLFDQSTNWVTNSPIINSSPFSGSEASLTTDLNSNNSVSEFFSRNAFRVKKSPVVKSNRRIRPDKKLSQSHGESDPSYLSVSNLGCNNYKSVACEGNLDDDMNTSEIHSILAPPSLPSPALVAKCVEICSNDSILSPQILTNNSPATPASLMRINQLSRELSIPNPMDNNEFNWTQAKDDKDQNPDQCVTESSEENIPSSSSKMLKSGSLNTPLIEQIISQSGDSNTQGLIPEISDAPDKLSCKPLSTPRCSRKKKLPNRLVPASPALLPRLSPNTKALLCSNGKQSEDSVSLLLASKSNYQNILEGTQFCDVFYPSELSTNLTSKRTSHKIAERGRRNRMNSALQEMATLLPHNQIKNSECEKDENYDRSDTEGSYSLKNTSQSTTSKAKTVEQAICYINFLKHQLEITKKELKEQKSRQELQMK